jgi:hypothetical protein
MQAANLVAGPDFDCFLDRRAKVGAVLHEALKLTILSPTSKSAA